jgi:hypothetical protein
MDPADPVGDEVVDVVSCYLGCVLIESDVHTEVVDGRGALPLPDRRQAARLLDSGGSQHGHTAPAGVQPPVPGNREVPAVFDRIVLCELISKPFEVPGKERSDPSVIASTLA